MIELKHELDGDIITINVVECSDDLPSFRDFIKAHKNCLAVDTETTGLDIYSNTFKCRLVQFGNRSEAWVLPVELDQAVVNEAVAAINELDRIVLKRASYDLQVLDRCFGLKMEDVWSKVTDIEILAKLVDPRPFEAGGFGHSLEELITEFISKEQADKVKTLMVKLAQEYKTTKAKIWTTIDLFHEEYLLYAGMDTVFTSIVCSKLVPLVPAVSKNLVPFEHKIAEICSYVDRNGFLLDVEYSQSLSDKWAYEQSVWEAVAFTEYGLEMVNSTEQAADALKETGAVLTGLTPKGKVQVNDAVLQELSDNGNELAAIIQESKKLKKWNTTWVAKFLANKDSNNRCHPFTNPLQARTSRMSVTGIPAQTLPASDSTVRNCFIADEGHVIGSIDYQTQELRVLAALSGDATMIQAFKDGADLHQITADAAGVSRKVGKMTNFLKVFGGGKDTLSANAAIDVELAKKVLDAFSSTYPGVERYGKQLAKEAKRDGYIITRSGRRLPVDSSRSYSALNYAVQSTARDVTCRALVRLHEAGFTPYIRLTIHDEIVASLPAERAQWGAQEIGRIMQEKMGPVLIGTDPEVGGRAWGSLYEDH